MNEQIIGTCSLCRGPVVLPLVAWVTVWLGPRCKSCGAIPAQVYGPEIPMQQPIEPASGGREAIKLPEGLLERLRPIAAEKPPKNIKRKRGSA